MKIFLTCFALLVAVLIIRFVSPPAVQAAPQDYTFTHSGTNFYSDFSLVYLLDDLDTDTQYIFDVLAMDDQANVTDSVAQRVIGPGVTTTSFIVTPTEWPDDFSGSLKVTDQFGQDLAFHYVLPPVNSDWETGSGNNAEDEKVGIAGVPFNSINGDGWHHNVSDHTQVLTRDGDFTFLHYRFDSTVTSTDLIRIYDIDDGGIEATFSLDELFNYNRHDDETFGVVSEDESFVILSTDGNRPVIVNRDEELTAFVSSNQNPFLLDIGQGVFDYERTDSGGSQVAPGESVWIVSNSTVGYEWQIEALNQQQASGRTQIARESAHSSAVWQDYHDQSLTDSDIGLITDSDFTFSTQRDIEYTAGTSVGDETLTWAIQAFGLNVAGPTIDEFRFEMTDSYSIVSELTVPQRIREIQARHGLDTPFGNVLILIGLFLFGFYLVKNFGFKHPAVHVMIFLGIGGAWVLSGFTTGLTNVLFGIGALIVVIVLFRSRGRATDE